MLEWMRKEKHKIGTSREHGLYPWKNPLKDYIFIMYKSVIQ